MNIHLTEAMYKNYEEAMYRSWKMFWLLGASLVFNFILVVLLVDAVSK